MCQPSQLKDLLSSISYLRSLIFVVKATTASAKTDKISTFVYRNLSGCSHSIQTTDFVTPSLSISFFTAVVAHLSIVGSCPVKGFPQYIEEEEEEEASQTVKSAPSD